MIQSFGDRMTRDLYFGEFSSATRRLSIDVLRSARRKLDMLDAAHDLRDLAAPPGNRLEGLCGSWAGFWSIRVNAQWRIVFRWRVENAEEVRLIDYHA